MSWKAPDPGNIHLLGAPAEVAGSQGLADAVEEAKLRGFGWAALSAGPRNSAITAGGGVEYWPGGLASWMDMSRVLALCVGSIGDRREALQVAQSDTLPDGFHRSNFASRAGDQRTGTPPAAIADIRSLFRSGTRVACRLFRGC